MFVTALEKKQWDVEAHMPEYETREGLNQQLNGGFELPTLTEVMKEAEFLEDSKTLLNLEMAPIRPRAGAMYM